MVGKGKNAQLGEKRQGSPIKNIKAAQKFMAQCGLFKIMYNQKQKHQ